MMSYGGLILFDWNETVKEWDTSESRWLLNDMPLRTWIGKIMQEGDLMLAELESDGRRALGGKKSRE
jgi:hypothetical protein